MTLLKVLLTLKVPEKLLLYGLYVYYVVHICDFGMLRVKLFILKSQIILHGNNKMSRQITINVWKMKSNFSKVSTIYGYKWIYTKQE